MAHTIEIAKTSRASCRTCRKPIAKGELRLGEEVPNAFAAGEVTHQWHHLPCGAKKKPLVFQAALAGTALDIPDRAALSAVAEEAAKTERPHRLPFVERAPTARSTCLSCSTPIDKGALRVAIEREVDTGSFVTKGTGYLHAACAAAHLAQPAQDLLTTLKAHSPALDADDVAALTAELAG